MKGIAFILEFRLSNLKDVRALIVDAHVHLIPGFPLQESAYIKFDWNDLDSWLSSQPRSKCILMPELTHSSDSVALNRRFFKSLSGFPKKDRVFPFLWIHPFQLRESHFKEFSFSGFKFHPSLSETTLDASNAMLDLCAKHKKPILVHCGRDMRSRIDYVLKMNEHYPDINFICAHLGGLAVDLIIRALEKMKEAKCSDNVFFDTACCFNPTLIRRAVEILGSDKIIFGSDRPFQDCRVSLYTIRSCNFDTTTARNIMFRNIQRILQRED